MEGGRTTRAEAERLLGIAEKLLQNKDFNGSRDFAVLAQETDPLLDGSDQILAVAEVHLASDRRINNHPDWYSVLQVERRCSEFELIKKQYRRLALLLHPDKNKFAYADSAFKLVADSWSVLSDPHKRSIFDNELSVFSRVDLVSSGRRDKQFHNQHHQSPQQQPKQNRNNSNNNPNQDQQKLPVKRGSGANASAEANGGTARLTSFWTVCPYCYNLFEYQRVYEGCCLRCQSCKRAFTATEIFSMPPFVPGKEAYYCCWGFFPMGFVADATDGGKQGNFPASETANGVAAENEDGFVEEDVAGRNAPPSPRPPPPQQQPAPRKVGRPRKNR